MGTTGKVLLGLLGLVVVLGLIGSMGSNQDSKNEYTSQRQEEEYSSDSNTSNNGSSSQRQEEVTQLERMKTVFEGEDFEFKFDRAMRMYGFRRTERNERRVINALIELRKANNVTELEILECVIYKDLDFERTEDGFAKAAAYCATFL